MHFSPSTKGFYTEAMHGNNIPQDVVEITAERHTALLAGQSAGHVITADKNGRPVLEARKVPDDAHYAKHARKQRGSLLLEYNPVAFQQKRTPLFSRLGCFA